MRSIRRSRSVAGLFAAAILIAASGCGSDDTGQQLSPAPTEVTEATESPDATDAADEPDSTWAPAVTDAPEPAQLVTSTPVEVAAPFAAVLEDSEYVPVQWLVPWDGGFLAIGVRYPPQPLPDQLPPEIAELFPPEVNALFPDGLPPTQQEATDILREAGLLDVVMDILNDNPEAMDAVQSAPRPDPALLAAWSIDGDSWMPTELSQPADTGAVSNIAVSGDRLTMTGAVQPADAGDPWIMTVASTTDLATWEAASFALPDTGGSAEQAQMWATPIAAATDDEHWVVRVMVDGPADAMADPESDLPESDSHVELWSGRWGGEPATSDAGQLSWMLLATNDGFLDMGERVAFSRDGQTWTELPDLAPNTSVQAAAPLGDDVLAIMGTPFGDSSIVVLDATGVTKGEVAIPELGDGFSVWSSMSSPAFIVTTEAFGPYEQTIVVEHEGFELTQEYAAVAAYRLVDLSTGDVVAEESVDLRTTDITGTTPFEYLTEGSSGVTISDPETGDAIVVVPHSVIGRAFEEAGAGDETTDEGASPDLWLLATDDGDTWLLHDLDEGAPDEFNPPLLVATNGSIVLAGTPGWEPGTDVWQRFTITE
jgi:hypothetical protein